MLAARHFALAGHRVVGFLPDYLLDSSRVEGKRRAAKLGIVEPSNSQSKSSKSNDGSGGGGSGGATVNAFKGYSVAAMPDDVFLLQQLVKDGILVGTPPQDYDDAYCIRYAQQHVSYCCVLPQQIELN